MNNPKEKKYNNKKSVMVHSPNPFSARNAAVKSEGREQYVQMTSSEKGKVTDDLDLPTGPLEYKLTNDYMFKAFLQKNEKALRGLICALLSLRSEDVSSVTILNPIELGKTATDKTLILDIKVMLNNNTILNIEMQVSDLGDWIERSLNYLCRAYDQLSAGQNYKDIKQTIHIGIVDFTPEGFPKQLYTDYWLYNPETGHIYSSKFGIYVLQLNQLGNPVDEKQMPELYHWAQLFKAETWEEIRMVAEKSSTVKDCVVTLKELTADERIRMECQAREDLRRDFESVKYAGYQEGMVEGKVRGKVELLHEMGYSIEDIAQKIALSVPKVEAIITSLER